MTDPDLLVIGAGTAGMAAARTARRAGHSVLLVAEGRPGGDCTFNGCVPSKTLIAAAADGTPYSKAVAQVAAAIERIAATEDEEVLRAAGIEVRRARAVLTGPLTVDVEGTVLRPGRVVLATGSAPVVPGIEGLASVPHLTNETVFGAPDLPRHLAVLGGGAIGCELAQAFRRLGSQVTVVEGGDRLLAKEEPEASRVVQAALEADGVTVRTGAGVERVDAVPDGVRLTLADGSTVTASDLLVAVGRRPVTEGLGLERAGVAVDDRGAVVTDSRLRTTAKGVWAAGDVTGKLPFTHAADVMGRLVGTSAFARGPGARFKDAAIPWVTFTDPEVGRVGLTEAQAAERVPGARVVELSMADVDRGITSGRTEGFVKLVVGPKALTRDLGGGRVVGATTVGPRGGELIAEVALAMATGMFVGRLAQTTHAYPSWSIAVQQCAAQLFGHGEGEARRAGG